MNICKRLNNIFDVMRLLRRILLLFLFAFLFLSLNRSSAFAFIYSSPSISQLVSKSELVVVGEVTTVEYVKANGGNAQVKVERILKGKLQKGKLQNNTIVISIPNASIMIPVSDVGTSNTDWAYSDSNLVVAKEYGMFFLQKGKAGFVSIDPMHLMLPVRKGLDVSDADFTDVLDLVRKELLYTALGPATFSKEDEAKSKIFVKIAQKYNQYAFAKDIHPIPINVKAVRYLAEPTFDNYGNVIPSHEHEAKALKTLLSTDKSPTLLRGAVLTTLLTLGQFDVLDEAVRFIDTTQQIPLAQKNVQISDEAAGLAQTIRFVNGAKYIPDLGNLLQNKNLEVRRSAITALANFVYQSTPFGKPMINLKDSVTLPFLIKALDDSDSEVRHRALRALPRATNKPSWDPPRLPTGYLDIAPKEEQKLIAQWKQWWKSEGSKAFDALPK